MDMLCRAIKGILQILMALSWDKAMNERGSECTMNHAWTLLTGRTARWVTWVDGQSLPEVTNHSEGLRQPSAADLTTTHLL